MAYKDDVGPSATIGQVAFGPPFEGPAPDPKWLEDLANRRPPATVGPKPEGVTEVVSPFDQPQQKDTVRLLEQISKQLDELHQLIDKCSRVV